MITYLVANKIVPNMKISKSLPHNKNNSPLSFLLIIFFCFFFTFSLNGNALISAEEDVSTSTSSSGPLVKRDQRRHIAVTEYGEISAVEIYAGHRKPYYLQFFTLDPNSLFLPVLLHADMIFYVDTGSGGLSWSDGGAMNRVNLRRGDIYRIREGSLFHVQSNLETEREKLRIYAIFADTEEELSKASMGAYSSIGDLVRGFDKRILQAAFQVPEEVIEEITNGTKSPTIVHGFAGEKPAAFLEFETRFLRAFVGGFRGGSALKNKKSTPFNILDANPDFKNNNGWSSTVNRKKLKLLKGSHIGLFMVNLTGGSMMGPHWNPMATEVAVVLSGEGMIRVVCAHSFNMSECKNMRFKVKEGDVFVVPRFHPMAQISFNNGSLVFMGFSTSTRKNHPQFLAGRSSVLQTLDRPILATSFDVSNTTIDKILASQADSIILECSSCAEEEERIMKEEIERKREREEARKREEEEEEEAKRREEEERRKRGEERRKKEEEEKREREQQERRRQEEAKREEEEARREQEEREREREKEEEKTRRQQEQEEAEREQEEARRQQEEREREREKEEEKARRQQEQEQAKQEQEEARRKQEEREGEREKEQEKVRRQQEQEEAEGEQEEARRQQEERERKREKQERRRQEQEEAEREEEEAGRQQEEREREREKEERRRQEQEEEEGARREQEEAKRQQEEIEGKREKEHRGEAEEEEAEQEQEEAMRQQKERETKREREEHRRQEQEEARREQDEARKEQEKREREEGAAELEQEEASKQEEERQRRSEEEEGRGRGRAERKNEGHIEGKRVFKMGNL